MVYIIYMNETTYTHVVRANVVPQYRRADGTRRPLVVARYNEAGQRFSPEKPGRGKY